jgi:hypothetical protein
MMLARGKAVVQHAFAAGDPAAVGGGEVPDEVPETAPSAGHMPTGGAPKRRAWLMRAASIWATTRLRPPG